MICSQVSPQLHKTCCLNHNSQVHPLSRPSVDNYTLYHWRHLLCWTYFCIGISWSAALMQTTLTLLLYTLPGLFFIHLFLLVDSGYQANSGWYQEIWNIHWCFYNLDYLELLMTINTAVFQQLLMTINTGVFTISIYTFSNDDIH